MYSGKKYQIMLAMIIIGDSISVEYCVEGYERFSRYTLNESCDFKVLYLIDVISILAGIDKEPWIIKKKHYPGNLSIRKEKVWVS